MATPTDSAVNIPIPFSRVDKRTGKVRIWDVNREAYIESYPVDAKEKIAMGGCLLDRPGDEPERERPRTSAPRTVPPAPESISAPTAAVAQARAGQGYEFGVHTVNELRAFAADAHVDGFESMRKGDLIAALERKRYMPPNAAKNLGDDGSNG